MLARYRRYLNRADLRRAMQLVKRQRGRKLLRNPKGAVYDLEQIFEKLNTQYFDGSIARPQLGWSRQSSRTTLGHYDLSHHAIVLSKLLDSQKAPALIVEFVLFHEMLHLKFPIDHKEARAQGHTTQFKKC
ncbi:MAG: SprT-like domain-containing protein [Acidobacteriaceae bacterium]|nr:SprT-like domain-containing protein [Acidobacteriaceae bacterium]MBV9778425.1 SprT-like domain-containing protein [Acidobacteriaceae bacterium]